MPKFLVIEDITQELLQYKLQYTNTAMDTISN